MGISETIIDQCFGGDKMGEESGKVKKARFSSLIRLMGMMKKGFWAYLVAIIAMSAAMSGFGIITAYLLKDVIAMAQSGDYTGILPMVLINAAEGIAVLLVYQVGFNVYTMEAKKGGANLQKQVLGKANRLPYEYYENTHSGSFLSKVVYDEEMAQNIYGSRFRRVLMPALMVVCYLIPMFALSWEVTSCLFAMSVCTFIFNAMFIKPMKNVSGKMSIAHSSLTECLSNIIAGTEQVKMFGLDKNMVEDYRKSNDVFIKHQKTMNWLSAGLEGINRFFDLSASLIFIAVGIFFVSIGITSVDRLAAIYVMYGSMSWNFLQIGIYIPSLAGCLVNAERVFEFLDMEEEPKAYKNVGKASGDGYIELENVCFSYDKDVEILHDFSLHIEKGETVALKGESGKGKSTIAKLLLGLYPVSSGNVSIDGRAMSDIELTELRDMIGYVPQEPYLYDVSIAKNIEYGRPGATMEEIVAAAKAANAHDFIKKQEDGYETIAGERGNRLSGGEKQRIAIARAILKNAPILILDEATSALDNESERLVNEAFENLMKGRTTIMIAHRLSTLERADRIVEI